jgi:hypothetical protein
MDERGDHRKARVGMCNDYGLIENYESYLAKKELLRAHPAGSLCVEQVRP